MSPGGRLQEESGAAADVQDPGGVPRVPVSVLEHGAVHGPVEDVLEQAGVVGGGPPVESVRRGGRGGVAWPGSWDGGFPVARSA